jgi:hypothetical protein
MRERLLNIKYKQSLPFWITKETLGSGPNRPLVKTAHFDHLVEYCA